MSEHRIMRITRNTRIKLRLCLSIGLVTLLALWPFRAYRLSSLPIFLVLLFAFFALCLVWLAPVFESHNSHRLSSPPGWRLRRFADFCFSKKTFTQVLEPILSDMQLEHIEALDAGRPWKARMVLVRGYYSFWSAVVAQLPIPFIRRVYEIWKATKIGS